MSAKSQKMYTFSNLESFDSELDDAQNTYWIRPLSVDAILNISSGGHKMREFNDTRNFLESRGAKISREFKKSIKSK